MKIQTFSFQYELVEKQDELTNDETFLLEKALQLVRKAYAPYSEFHVAAALLLENGETVVGNNQENMAYPSGLCAERVALFYAKAHFPEVPIVGMVIIAESEKFPPQEPVTPCGACRQVMIEYEMLQKKPYWILLWDAKKNKGYHIHQASHLLPFYFKLNI